MVPQDFIILSEWFTREGITRQRAHQLLNGYNQKKKDTVYFIEPQIPAKVWQYVKGRIYISAAFTLKNPS